MYNIGIDALIKGIDALIYLIFHFGITLEEQIAHLEINHFQVPC